MVTFQACSQLHLLVFASKALLQLPPDVLYITSHLRLLSRAGIHPLPSARQNQKSRFWGLGEQEEEVRHGSPQ